MKKIIFICFANFAIMNLSFSQNSSLGNFSVNDFGELHNQILEIINKSGISIYERDSISNLLIEELPIIDNRFNVINIKTAVNALYDNENFQKNILSNDKNVLDFQNYILNKLVSSEIVSTKFSEIINSIYDKDILTFNEIVNYQLTNGNLSLAETNYLNVYSSVYNSSYIYWNSLTKKPKPCKWCTTAGDAVGSLLGLFGTPAWAIIQGALVSMALES